MEWVYAHRPKGESDSQFFQHELFTDTEARIIKHATVNGTFYAAVRSGEGRVWGLAVLISPRIVGHFNTGYIAVPEDMGPIAADAPVDVLDALDDTDCEYALDWRRRCRTNLEQHGGLSVPDKPHAVE